MCWTDWKNIDEVSEYNGRCPYNGCAIYKIRMRIGNKKVPIPRFFKIDKEGLLCIGKTENFERRRNDFIRGWERGYGHAGANLLYLLNKHTNIRRIFRNYTCQYSFKRIGQRQINKLESQEIIKYVKKYGEAPPLNSVIPGRNNMKSCRV